MWLWIFFAAIAAFVVGKSTTGRLPALPAPELPALPLPPSEMGTRRRGIIIDVTDESRQAHADRVRTAEQLERNFEHSPHYESDKWIAKYAEANRKALLSEREKILSAWRTISKDALLVEILREKKPSTYRRMSWQVRALAKAEEQMVSPADSGGSTPAAPPPDPVAEATQVIEEDARREVALTAAIHRARESARAEYRTLNMPEDEINRRVDELEEKLLTRARSTRPQPGHDGAYERY